jgi:type I restriction enzyme S subunit
LRFKEFNTAWIHSKIGEICEIEMCKRIFSNQTNTIGGVPFYKIGTIGGKPDTWISENLFNEYKDKYNYPKKGEILITCSGTVGKCIIFNGKDAYFQDSNIVWLANKSTVLDIFLFYIMNNIDWSYLNSTTITRIYGSDLRNLNFYYPNNKNEQQKITDFLSLLDQRIDTQSKIIEDLQTLKISICDKVFEDTTYPEYKLKDVLSERIEKSNVNNQYEILSSTIKGLFTQKEYFDKDIASSNNIGYKIVHLYDIIISPQNLWMGNITFNQRFTNGLVSPSYKIYIINNNFDMYYIANMLKTKRAMYKYICSSQQGASVVRRNLNMDDFLSLSFNIPDIIKQRKIGLLLNTIDKRIDLEQTYLTKLNQQKKFLLKNMFI